MANHFQIFKVFLTLYHYTSERNARKIEEQELIKASDPDGPDAKFGEGKIKNNRLISRTSPS